MNGITQGSAGNGKRGNQEAGAMDTREQLIAQQKVITDMVEQYFKDHPHFLEHIVSVVEAPWDGIVTWHIAWLTSQAMRVDRTIKELDPRMFGESVCMAMDNVYHRSIKWHFKS